MQTILMKFAKEDGRIHVHQILTFRQTMSLNQNKIMIGLLKK